MAELAIKITADDQASKALEGIQGRIQGMSKGLRMANSAIIYS